MITNQQQKHEEIRKCLLISQFSHIHSFLIQQNTLRSSQNFYLNNTLYSYHKFFNNSSFHLGKILYEELAFARKEKEEAINEEQRAFNHLNNLIKTTTTTYTK